MKNTLYTASLVTLLFTSQVFAETATTTTNSEYQTCVHSAEARRDLRMKPAQKAYAASNAKINEEAQKSFTKIMWLTDSVYTREYNKILSKKEEEVKVIMQKINKARTEADATKKAELALCDRILANASSTQKLPKNK